MSARTDIPSLQRIRFFSGQRLTAEDMTALQKANRELRWLHNRSLHGWGIGTGFGVTGARGASSVTIEPGYAIDCMGREIFLTEPATMSIPAVAGVLSPENELSPAVYYLTASYKDDTSQNVAEKRPGVCVPGGTVRAGGRAGARLASAGQNHGGDGHHSGAGQHPELPACRRSFLAVRRSARPSQQPYIAAGQTPPETHMVGHRCGRRRRRGFDNVSTSGARFQSTPQYFAHVVGSRSVSTPAFVLVVNVLPVVRDPAPDQFVCEAYVVFPGSPAAVAGALPRQSKRLWKRSSGTSSGWSGGLRSDRGSGLPLRQSRERVARCATDTGARKRRRLFAPAARGSGFETGGAFLAGPSRYRTSRCRGSASKRVSENPRGRPPRRCTCAFSRSHPPGRPHPGIRPASLRSAIQVGVPLPAMRSIFMPTFHRGRGSFSAVCFAETATHPRRSNRSASSTAATRMRVFCRPSIARTPPRAIFSNGFSQSGNRYSAASRTASAICLCCSIRMHRRTATRLRG